MHGGGPWPSGNSFNLLRINLNTYTRDTMTQIGNQSEAGLTLVTVYHKGVMGQCGQCETKMLKMSRSVNAVDENIIDKDKNGSSELVLEDCIHSRLEDQGGVAKAEQHDAEYNVVVMQIEGGFQDGIVGEFDLVEAGLEVYRSR